VTAGFDSRALAAIFARFAGDERPAYLTGDRVLTFDALHRGAVHWAGVLAAGRGPVLIHGHKEAGCVVAWWACLLAARPLVPVEPDLPLQRIRDIAAATGARLMLVASAEAPDPAKTGLDHLLIDRPPPSLGPPVVLPLPRSPGDAAYILCSSGTTGRPKCIQVSYANLDGFVRWLDGTLLADAPLAAISGNVRYCFDVSLFELWTSWLRRVPLVALDHAEFFHSRRQIVRYGAAAVGLWVSTPSVAQIYLRDPAFRAENLPTLRTFLFCGEVLPKPLVTELWRRFPGARILNTYGPTECTVAVTSVAITPAMIADPRPLPIGRPRPGCRLAADRGEIVIHGDVVGPGYLGLPDRQAAAFPAPQTYRTGDRGEQAADGLWYFKGRGDREVKIQGVRVDLDEVEAALRALPGVEAAVVELQVIRGIPRAMAAFLAGPAGTAALAGLSAQLSAGLPPALVPRFWYAAPGFSVNLNSKLDRAALIAAARRGGIVHVHD
jgi:D-alanine--poly(phosphoribitol) ligase subunit 1